MVKLCFTTSKVPAIKFVLTALPNKTKESLGLDIKTRFQLRSHLQPLQSYAKF